MKQRTVLSILTLVTIGSLAAATGTVLVLHPEDKISIARGCILTALGFVFFLSLFDLLNHVALKTANGLRFRKNYQLTVGDVLDINNKVVSAVQALFCCLTGLIVCLYSCTRDLVHTSHFMSEAYAWYGAAYFFYDIYSMYKVHISMNSGFTGLYTSEKTWKKISKSNSTQGNHSVKKLNSELKSGKESEFRALAAAGKKSVSGTEVATFLEYCKDQPVILFHHLFIGGFGFLVIVYLRGGLGDCVFGFVYLMELSTPMVSARGILSRLKLKESRLYVFNGVLMVLTFFVCRILCLPYVCHLYSQMIGLSYWEGIHSLPTGCKISISILMLPQLYWFYLMIMGAYKVFFPKNNRAGVKNDEAKEKAKNNNQQVAESYVPRQKNSSKQEKVIGACS